MELTVILAAMLVVAGGLVVLAAVLLREFASGRWDLTGPVLRLVGELPGRIGRRGGRALARQAVKGRPVPAEGTFALTLAVGLVVLAATAAGLTKLTENVTEGDGIAILDHPVARFVAARRTPPLNSVLEVVTTVGGPAGMAVLVLVASVVLGLAWRSWVPALLLTITFGGIGCIALLVKSVLGRPRPPLAHALIAAGGFSFPSGHAAIATAVCGAVAWLCGLRMRSWLGQVGFWVASAMVAALVGASRVYLGVHWTSDIIGGWAFGALWLAVVVSSWAIFSRSRRASVDRRIRPG